MLLLLICMVARCTQAPTCTTGSVHLHFKEAAVQSLLHKDVAQLLTVLFSQVQAGPLQWLNGIGSASDETLVLSGRATAETGQQML